ncbi:unnamed protein product [Trifolium pratense]|uniref:Uncharacterized protein n=1 Tax=Trifolium pratense TaxID=57577 RepID=A0ACB0LXI5_TRIPR|nr:unnamed protein product [Trifolium pratense]
MVFIISHAIRPTSSTKIYEDICKNGGDNEQRCLKVIEAYPEITLAKDKLSFCQLFAKNVAIGEAIKAQNYIKEMMNKYPSSEAIKECATTGYNEVVSEFKGVVIEDPEMEDLVVQYANDGIRVCESALAKEKTVDVSSIYTLNNDMRFLIGILQRGAQGL